MDTIKYPVEAVFVPVQRGSSVLLDPLKNRMVKNTNETNNKAIYECCKKKTLHCPVKVTLDVEKNMIISGCGEHNHNSDLLKTWVKNEVVKVVEGVYNNPAVPPRAIVQEVENRVMATPGTSAGLACIPKAKSVARMVQRKRKAEWGGEGNLPTCWSEMLIPDQYLKTTSEEDFVLLEES